MSNNSLRIVAVLLLVVCAAGPVQGNTGTVDEVLSGDLVRIGDSFIARLAGIKAPPRNEVMGYQIKLFTWTTDNTAAGIVYDEEDHAFVQIYYSKGMETSLNEVLLEKGYARVDKEYLPDELKYYLELEKEAREKGLGIWADSK